MGWHRAFGLLLKSQLPLPELEEAGAPADGTAPDIRLELAAHDGADGDEPWIPLTFSNPSVPWSSMCRRGGAFRVRVGDLADFDVDAGGSTVVCRPVEDLAGETLRHLLLDHLLPALVAHRGGIVLHGSAVVVDGAVLAFVGPSGAGKSTLASALCDRGHRLVADDALWIEAGPGGFTVRPSYPGLRIWPGSCQDRGRSAGAAPMADYSPKVRLAGADLPGGAAAAPAPLRRLFLLGPPGDASDIVLGAVGLGDAVHRMLQSCFLLDPEDRERLRAQFLMVTSPALARAVRSLDYPREENRLDDVLDRVLAEAGTP